MRARHHTGHAELAAIKRTMVITPSRGDVIGVFVELEPFGTPRPGGTGPKTQMGCEKDGAYVEIDLPASAERTPTIGPRTCAVIPTKVPLPIADLNPVFVKIYRRWWEFWKDKPGF